NRALDRGGRRRRRFRGIEKEEWLRGRAALGHIPIQYESLHPEPIEQSPVYSCERAHIGTPFYGVRQQHSAGSVKPVGQFPPRHSSTQSVSVYYVPIRIIARSHYA